MENNFYSENVKMILNKSFNYNKNLFSNEEINLYNNFLNITNESSILLSRILNRNRKWYLNCHIDKYVKNIEKCKLELFKSELIEKPNENDIETLLESFNQEELLIIYSKLYPNGKNQTRNSLLNNLKGYLKMNLIFYEKPSQRLLKIIKNEIGECINVSKLFKIIFQRCCMLFFLEPYYLLYIFNNYN